MTSPNSINPIAAVRRANHRQGRGIPDDLNRFLKSVLKGRFKQCSLKCSLKGAFENLARFDALNPRELQIEPSSNEKKSWDNSTRAVPVIRVTRQFLEPLLEGVRPMRHRATGADGGGDDRGLCQL